MKDLLFCFITGMITCIGLYGIFTFPDASPGADLPQSDVVVESAIKFATKPPVAPRHKWNVTGHELRMMILELAVVIPEVETNWNNSAVGSSGERGIFQILPGYWEDGCRFAGVDWDYQEDVLDEVKAEFIFDAYLSYYGEAMERRERRAMTIEDLARIHNGGPLGYKRPATLPYWNKVKAVLEGELK